MKEPLEYPSKARIFRIRNLERVRDKRVSPLWFIVSRVEMDQWYSTVSQSVFSVESIPRQAGIANGSVYFSTSAEQMFTRAYFELRFSRIALRAFTIASKVLILFKRKEVTRSLLGYSRFAVRAFHSADVIN